MGWPGEDARLPRTGWKWKRQALAVMEGGERNGQVSLQGQPTLRSSWAESELGERCRCRVVGLEKKAGLVRCKKLFGDLPTWGGPAGAAACIGVQGHVCLLSWVENKLAQTGRRANKRSARFMGRNYLVSSTGVGPSVIQQAGSHFQKKKGKLLRFSVQMMICAFVCGADKTRSWTESWVFSTTFFFFDMVFYDFDLDDTSKSSTRHMPLR